MSVLSLTAAPFRSSASVPAGFSVRTSTELNDPAWDRFLETIPTGQVQQSSLWAQSKGADGWRPIRVTFQHQDTIVGGFQMLTRRTRFGRIAYIAKGPALASDQPQLAQHCFQAIISTAKTHRIRALVAQAPDESAIPSHLFSQHGFAPNHLLSVISATLCIDVSSPMDVLLSRMRRTTLLELKRAQKRGIHIREGTEADLSVFFKLMLQTCKRQETVPSPASIQALEQVWNAFRPQNLIRLSLAEYDGQPLAAAICLCFGDRVTFWKKGWSGAHKDKHPNQMVMFEAIQWAQANGYRTFDCLAMTRSTAESLLKGVALTDEQKSGRDFFLLGYGGRPVLLPDSWVYIPNSILRLGYNTAIRFPWFQSIAKRLLKAA